MASRSDPPDRSDIWESRADPGELRVFVPVTVKNDSQTGGHWAGKARRARTQIDATCAAILTVLRGHKLQITAKPSAPKRVIFIVAHPPPAFDEPDGLSASCKHLRDGLIHAGLLDNDAPQNGHVFSYAQVLTRVARGVLVIVSLKGTTKGS
jgi:hypothetical protein